MTTYRKFAVVAVVILWIGMTESTPVSTPVSPPVSTNQTQVCPPVIMTLKDGECSFVTPEVEAKVTAEMNKRQLGVPDQTCPYCATGVYDVFPDWDDCTKFNFCLNGHIISFECQEVRYRFFNPILKACELFQSKNNMCMDRSVSLLSVQA